MCNKILVVNLIYINFFTTALLAFSVKRVVKLERRPPVTVTVSSGKVWQFLRGARARQQVAEDAEDAFPQLHDKNLHTIPRIGIEAHCKLNTLSKLFCKCNSKSLIGSANCQVCPVCTGEPGSLQQPNLEAVFLAVHAATLLNCTINPFLFFQRKHYFYFDSPKNYQITQYSNAIGRSGKFIGHNILRVQLEEDSSRLCEGVFISFHLFR